jgi:excisionase family DNA binding protein
MNPEGYKTGQEIADYLGVSLRTITRLVRKGRIPSTKIGGARRFKISEVEAYLNENNRAPVRRRAA